MITAEQQGLNLAITVEGIEAPFVIRPLPGRMGKALTDIYLRTMARELHPENMEDVFRIALDGGRWADDERTKLVPLPEAEQLVYNRCEDTLSQAAGQDVLHAAFFWQTVLGIAGVNAYVEAGGGFAGGVKTLGSLVQTLGISPLTTSPSSALETLIRSQASTSPTTSPTAGSTIEKLPANRRSRKPSKKRQ
jgi:hypothetical protein